jgi:HSP20 family molecular chaperone IbpA
MTEKQDITVRQHGDQSAQQRAAEGAVRPAVDIFEDTDGITLLLDMPGVSKERLSVQADKNSLTVEGTAQFDVPEGMEALYADLRTSQFRRSFALSSELDVGNIHGSLKDGVLTLRVPKAAHVRPRRIEVSAG